MTPEELQATELLALLQVTPHPVVAAPAAAQVVALLRQPDGKAKLIQLVDERRKLIERMKKHPLRAGWKPKCWEDANELIERYRRLLVLGGNRSTKTEYAAWRVVDKMVAKPKQEWAFFHSSSDSSIRLQQPRIYKYLPPEWRDLGKVGNAINVSYTIKNGFSDNVFILPNGSRGYFFNYLQDPRVLEGYEFDGAWCDELVPLEFIEALDFRLTTRKGELLITFTPVTGYTPTVGRYVAGAKIVDSRPSPLLPNKNVKDCPAGRMPYILESPGRKGAVICFFTEWNLFNPYEELVRQLAGDSDGKVKMRAYGWVDKMTGTAFPKFGEVNIVTVGREWQNLKLPWVENGIVPSKPWQPTEQRPALYPSLPKAGTNYRFADPGAFRKNWVIKWFRCGAEPQHAFIYREWPDWATHGAWAEPGSAERPDGKPGPAQRSEFGRTILDYKKLILESEGWVWDEREGAWNGTKAEVIFESYIDPRMGGAEVPSAEEGTSIISMMADEQRDRDGRIIGPSMIWLPAPGTRVHDGMEILSGLFGYDNEKPVTINNCPTIYVCEQCAQSIYAFREYTGLDGEKGALKDIVDPDRYFAKSGVGYVAPMALGSRGGGSY